MKAWFVYLVDGKRIGTWANNCTEAEKNLHLEFREVPMEFLDIYSSGIGVEPEKIIMRGMSPVDSMIAFGFLNMFTGLRGLK